MSNNKEKVVVNKNMDQKKNNAIQNDKKQKMKKKKKKSFNKIGYNAPNQQVNRQVFRERFLGVNSSINYAPGVVALNPGLETWTHLSTIAKNFEKYRFRKVLLHYVPSVNQYNVNAGGEVAAYFDSDPRDSSPDTFTTFINNTSAKKCLPYQRMTIDVSRILRNLNAAYLIRTSIKPNLESYDIGAFHIAVSGQANNGALIGHLELEYVVDLFSPQSGDQHTLNYSYAEFAGLVNISTGSHILAPPDVENRVGIRLTASRYYLPAGQWEVVANLNAQSTTGFDCIQTLGVAFSQNGGPISPTVYPYDDQTATNLLRNCGCNTSLSLIHI